MALFLGMGAGSLFAADNGTGGRGAFDFLKLSPIARALGMGEAYTAAGDDVGSIFYNPAGLASILTNEFNFTYLDLYQGVSDEFIAFAYPLGPQAPKIGGVLAASVNLLQFGTSDRTLNDGTASGTYSSGDSEFTLAYAREFGSYVHGGISGSFLRQQIDTASTSKVGVNAGVVVLPPVEGMRVGVAIKNLAAQADGFDLPMSLSTGISYRRYQLFGYHGDGAIDFDGDFAIKPIEDRTGLRVGLEYNYKWVGQRATLRVGYKFLDTDVSGVGLTVGGGYGMDWGGTVMVLDYAFAPNGDFGATHRISLSTKF